VRIVLEPPAREASMNRVFAHRVPGILAILLFAAPAPLAAEGQGPGGNGETEVRTVVETYLHGLKFNDVPSFRKAFWPDARLLFVRKNGQLGQLTQEDWYRGFEKVAGKEEEGTLRILALEVTGLAASVKVEEIYPKDRYVNYLSLLKLGGEWKIVNKIFDVRTTAPAAPAAPAPAKP
jgi:protease I